MLDLDVQEEVAGGEGGGGGEGAWETGELGGEGEGEGRGGEGGEEGVFAYPCVWDRIWLVTDCTARVYRAERVAM